ncbi:MAG: hypothetical protein QXR56_09075, partial [Thermofilaceae archaeon]
MKLWELVARRAERKGLLGACLELYRQWVEGEIEVEDPSPPSSLFSYFVRLDYSLWLWLLLTLSALTITVVTVTEAGLAVLLPARYVLGT